MNKNINSKSFAKKISKVLEHFKTSESLFTSLEAYNITRFDFDEYIDTHPLDKELFERIQKSVYKNILDKTQKRAFSKDVKIGTNVQLEILKTLDKERFRIDKVAEDLSNDLTIEELEDLVNDLRDQLKK